jgi:hypothetical protein
MDNPIKKIALFIQSNPKSVISFLNREGYAKLPNNASLSEINEAVSGNITDNEFVARIVEYVYMEGSLNAIGQVIGAIGQAVGVVITSVSNSVNQTKLRKSQERSMLGEAYSDAKYQRELLELAEREAESKFNLQLLAYQEQQRRADERSKVINQVIGGVVILAVFVGGAFLFKKLAK